MFGVKKIFLLCHSMIDQHDTFTSWRLKNEDNRINNS